MSAPPAEHCRSVVPSPYRRVVVGQPLQVLLERASIAESHGLLPDRRQVAYEVANRDDRMDFGRLQARHRVGNIFIEGRGEQLVAHHRSASRGVHLLDETLPGQTIGGCIAAESGRIAQVGGSVPMGRRALRPERKMYVPRRECVPVLPEQVLHVGCPRFRWPDVQKAALGRAGRRRSTHDAPDANVANLPEGCANVNRRWTLPARRDVKVRRERWTPGARCRETARPAPSHAHRSSAPVVRMFRASRPRRRCDRRSARR